MNTRVIPGFSRLLISAGQPPFPHWPSVALRAVRCGPGPRQAMAVPPEPPRGFGGYCRQVGVETLVIDS